MPKLPVNASYTDALYKTEKNRNYLVVKQNQIVQNTCYTMPLADQKILACLIRSIKPNQKSLKLKFSAKQYMKLLGMKWSGTTFAEICYSLKHIADDSFYIKHPDGSYDLWRWLYRVHADPNGAGKGDFVVTFPKELKPYLFNPELRDKTIYKFSDIMLMHSRYSPRLYEIFKSNRSKQAVQKRGLNYTLYELKMMLDLVYRDKRTHRVKHRKDGSVKFKYPAYYEFKRHILIPTCKEINKYTEYNIQMKPIHRHGRKTVGINVVMTHKNKKQIHKRDDIIFFITHHVPKSQWKTWREDTIRGNFRKIKPRKRNPKKIKAKVVNANKDIDSPKQRKQQQKEIENILNKHKVPFKEVNLGGNKLEYYNPWIDAYVWTTKKKWRSQYILYLKQQEIKKKKQQIIKKFKQDRAKKYK